MDRRALVAQIGCAPQLSDTTLDAVACCTVLQQVARGAVITLEDEPADALYLVAAGRVKIVRYSREGREHILRVAEAGDLFNSVPVLERLEFFILFRLRSGVVIGPRRYVPRW